MSKMSNKIDEPIPGIKYDEVLDQNYFEVTAVIGRVDLSPTGTMDPVVAAFELIGRHRAEGVYRFPHEDGGFWVVSVGVDRPSEARNGDH